ncbi:MAG: hypothetical protein ACREDD_07480 [Methylocella sp.]
MGRVNLVDPATATGAAKPLLDEIKGAFGTAPNMFRAVANSPAALDRDAFRLKRTRHARGIPGTRLV